jgi:hypothetical protein
LPELERLAGWLTDQLVVVLCSIYYAAAALKDICTVGLAARVAATRSTEQFPHPPQHAPVIFQ